MAGEIEFTYEMHERLQRELHSGARCVDDMVSQFARDNPSLRQAAAEVAARDEDPIIQLVRLYDLPAEDTSPEPLYAGEKSTTACVGRVVYEGVCFSTQRLA